MTQITTHWFRSPPAWHVIAWRYVPILAGLNLLWEVAQLPLYTLWSTESVGEIAFAVFHCTLGDTMIGLFTLLFALTVSRAGAPSTWPRMKVAAIATVAAVGYTMYSEWFNTSVRTSWAYSHLMPVIPIVGTGLAPFLQWLVIPSLALALSLYSMRGAPNDERHVQASGARSVLKHERS